MASKKRNTKKIDTLLQLAHKNNASDLHLAANVKPYLRIDGHLLPIDKSPELKPAVVEEMVRSLLTLEQQAHFEVEHELDFAYQTSDGVRYRMNISLQQGTFALAARVVPLEVPTLEQIDMPEIVYDLLSLRSGLIMITGPTGQGKSTSMAAMVDYINENRTEHIITLEDPVEFFFQPKKSLIKQRQLGLDFTSFPEALKHVVRQDPNVIMLGEMRDLDTIASAVTLAETGHLVFATLHTFTAANTIDRIIDIFPGDQQEQVRLQVSMILRAVVSQRLLPKIGGGRSAVREILISNSAVANLIRENKIAQIVNVLQTSAKEGMKTMDQALVESVKAGLVTRENARLYLEDPKLLK